MKPIANSHNKQITEYQQDNNIANKPMEQWVIEAKKHLADLQAMRQKINQINENK
jgi:hypothetical protein